MQNICPHCQSPIPADAPGGLCPACILLGVAGPTNPSQAIAARAPTLEEIAAAFPELEILEVIGQGGMGIVFKARQPRLDRLVALKILPPALAAQPGFSERFTREARVLARLAHPHIVAIYDFGESAGFFYLTMEFVNGVNLRAAMRAGVKPEQALLLVPKICEALQFAHDHGVLHRDIKPENILLDTRGTPKLADFGIAKLTGDGTDEPHATHTSHPGLTSTGSTLGTAAYMAPEQIEKPATVDHRADIYSLGVVLYEMLTGELPLGRFAAPSEKSTVNRGVDEVVMRALEKERDRRQQSATEMKTQVEGAISQTPAPTPSRTAASYTCTPEHRFSLRGMIYIYTGRGRLALDEATLTFASDAEQIRIPLGSIREIGIGNYSGFAKPIQLDFFSVVWDEAGVIRTRLFTPYESPLNPAWETNKLVAEWAAAVRTAAGRVLGREPSFVPSGALGTRLPSWLLTVGSIVGLPLLIAVTMFLFFAASRSGYGLLHMLEFCALLAAFVGLIAFFRPKARPASAVESTAKVPARNPWPRRVFFLLLAFILVPTLLLGIGLLIPWLARGEARKLPTHVASARVMAESSENARLAATQLAAFHEWEIGVARKQLEILRRQFENGTATQIQVGEAERDLAIADANGDARKIAIAKVEYAEKRVALLRELQKAGTSSNDELNAAENALTVAQVEKSQAEVKHLEREVARSKVETDRIIHGEGK